MLRLGSAVLRVSIVKDSTILPGVASTGIEVNTLEPIFKRYGKTGVRLYFRADAAFAKPEAYLYLEDHSFLYAIRLAANDILEREIKHLLQRPEGELSEKPVIRYHDFKYQAKSWEHPRRVVAKVEWHQGQLFP